MREENREYEELMNGLEITKKKPKVGLYILIGLIISVDIIVLLFCLTLANANIFGWKVIVELNESSSAISSEQESEEFSGISEEASDDSTAEDQESVIDKPYPKATLIGLFNIIRSEYYYFKNLDIEEYNQWKRTLLEKESLVSEDVEAFVWQVIMAAEDPFSYILNSEKYSDFIYNPDSTLTYETGLFQGEGALIRFTEFNEETSEAFEEALIKIKEKELDRLVIDLRNNSGGSVEEYIEIADMFLEDEEILTFKDRKNSEQIVTAKPGSYDFYKIHVLVNEETASCAEMLALVLKDNLGKRVDLIGKSTFGKDKTQTIYDNSAYNYSLFLVGNQWSVNDKSVEELEYYLERYADEEMDEFDDYLKLCEDTYSQRTFVEGHKLLVNQTEEQDKKFIERMQSGQWQSNGNRMFKYGDFIYYIDNSKAIIKYCDYPFKADPEDYYEVIAQGNIREIFYYGGEIYYTEGGDAGKLLKIGLNGGEVVHVSDRKIEDFIIYKERIYFSENNDVNDNGLYSMRLDGSDLRQLLNKKPFAFTMNENWIYYSYTNEGTFRIGLSGKNKLKLTNKRASLFSFDQTALYIDNNIGSTGIYKIDLDTLKVKEFSKHFSGIGLNTFNNTLYYIRSQDDEVYKMDMGSRGVKSIYSEQPIGRLFRIDHHLFIERKRPHYIIYEIDESGNVVHELKYKLSQE